MAFDGTASADPDGTIAAYAWDFGDTSTGTGATPSHTYNTDGAFTATLTVTDDEGAAGTATAGVTITPIPEAIVSNFEIGRGSGTAFIPSADGSFAKQEQIVFQVTLVDQNNQPLAGAVVQLDLSGANTATFTSSASDANGIAEVIWQTGKKTATGNYTATIGNVTPAGTHQWLGNGGPLFVDFTVN